MQKIMKWKRFRLKFLRFIYTQKELLDLKEYCKTKLNTKASELYQFGSKPMVEGKIDTTIPQQLREEFNEIQRVQKKVKMRLAFNNFPFMNNIIFNRENLKKEHFTLVKFTEGKDKGNKKLLFDQLSTVIKDKKRSIEYIIQSLNHKIKKLTRIQEKWNDRLFSFITTRSFVLKEFEKRRFTI